MGSGVRGWGGNNEHAHPRALVKTQEGWGKERGNNKLPTPAEGAGPRAGLRDTEQATPLRLLDTMPD